MNNIIKAENLKFDYAGLEDDFQREAAESGGANGAAGMDCEGGAGGVAGTLAIDDISFSIERGSFVTVIGRNGSGKSTLAKNINALLIPSSGTLWVNGYDTKEEALVWDIRQSAGMVFQNPDNQLVSTIVEDDVAFGPENLGIPPAEIRERVDSALKDVGMYEFRKKAPHLLSGGQKQRIAIAGVVAMKPECIVFDEPTAMLDPKGRGEVMKIAHELNREGITIILITHFMEEALLSDRIIIMDGGRIIMDGAPQEVFAHSERLRAINLDIPMSVALAEELRKRGVEIPADAVTEQALADCLLAMMNADGK